MSRCIHTFSLIPRKEGRLQRANGADARLPPWLFLGSRYLVISISIKKRGTPVRESEMNGIPRVWCLDGQTDSQLSRVISPLFHATPYCTSIIIFTSVSKRGTAQSAGLFSNVVIPQILRGCQHVFLLPEARKQRSILMINAISEE
jgi:hypothetical protein